MGAVFVIATRSITDIPTTLLAMGAALILLYTKGIKEPLIVFIAAVVGLIVKVVLYQYITSITAFLFCLLTYTHG